MESQSSAVSDVDKAPALPFPKKEKKKKKIVLNFDYEV